MSFDPDILSERLRAALQASVDAGEHATQNEAVRSAVTLWAVERDKRLDLMRAQIRRSMEDPRPDIDLDEAFDQIEAEIMARIEASGEEDEAA